MQLSDLLLVKKIKKGTIVSIILWLKDHVPGMKHRYFSQERVKVVSGKTLTDEPLIRYLQQNFTAPIGIHA